MCNTSQGRWSHTIYRNNNLSNLCDRHYPEHSQFDAGSRRAALSGVGGGSFGTNRGQFRQCGHSRSIPELVRETGLILEVQREYGRILSQSNFSAPNIHIYFSSSTLVNDAPLSVITDNLSDIFQAGAMVEIEVEGGVNLKELKDRVHVILACTSIRPSTEIGHKPELVPMVVIQDDHEIPLALIANHELVAIPRHVFPIEEVTSAYMAKRNSVTTNVGWPEFATVGRSIEGRIINAPPWIREFTNPTIKKIALSIQRFGRDREGFAVIKEYIKRGVVLTPIDEEDKKICGDLFFPYEMRGDLSRAVTEYKDIYRLGSKWYFRACPELPNRKYKYRVYNLSSLDDVLTGNLIAQERPRDQRVDPSFITTQDLTGADVSTSGIEAVASTNHEPDDSHQLIELDSEPLSVSSPNASVPEVRTNTLNLLGHVNFHTSSTPIASDINETAILQSSNSSDVPDSNLLIDFSTEGEVQQGETQTRHFHVLDEDFNLSLFNFDFKEANKCNYKAEVLDCNNHENQDMCLRSQIKASKNANLNCTVNGFIKPKESVKVECDCAMEFTTCKPKKCVESCSVLRDGNSAVDELIDINNPIIDHEISDDDSENQIFHAVSVERQNDDGWWFTRKASDKTDLAEERKINDELMRAPCCVVENSETTELNSVSEDDKPLLILNDDHAKNCETASLSMTPQISLSNALQKDGVYAKFFAELL
ncbi:unnamed protein product [Litomosoides sigmodontis]|uniref:Uncharacterized protein n=1 Tax=Litomosoides sigmodontis TaxID=42156 RepID=A0A3P6VFV8_LITSI|nr:unnamed protein product [Litomosoides sigmodontis]